MSVLEKASLVLIPSGYKEDVLYSQVPNTSAGDFTFTRASTGTRVNSDGYIEEVPWNLINYSEDFSQSSWSKVGTTVIGGFPSPNGPTNAYKLVEDTSSGAHYLAFVNISVKSGSYYTSSAFFKKGESNFIQLLFSSSSHAGGNHANFDLQNGVVGNVSDGVAEIESIGEYYRCSYTSQATASTTTNVFFWKVQSATSSRAESYSGDGTSGVYVWGAQAVKGNAPKPYIKTTDRLDIPRLDYSGGATCPTLKVEEQRTNYVPDSENWTGFSGLGVTKYANQTDINGGSQAMRIVYASGVVGYPGFNLGGTRNGKASIYIKSNTSDTYNMRMSSNTNAAQNITVTPTWQRITVDAVNWTIMSLDNYDNGVWAAADISTCFWQMEEGNFPTSYIPTSGTSVTRTVDSFEADNLSTIIGQTEGCIFIDFVYYEGNRFYIYDNGSTADGFLIYRSGTTYNLQVGNGGTYWAITNFITGLTVGESYKLAINYKLNDYKVYVNGSQTATNTSIEVPTTNKIISSQLGGSNKFTNDIKSFVLFNETLTNDELVVLTGGTVVDTYNWIDSDSNEMITSDGDNLIFT